MKFEPACTPAQTATLERDTAMRAVKKLTGRDVIALRDGVRHPDGVMRPSPASNYDRPEKRMAKLVAAGLATPNAHGDWYITDFGRRVVSILHQN